MGWKLQKKLKILNTVGNELLLKSGIHTLLIIGLLIKISCWNGYQEYDESVVGSIKETGWIQGVWCQAKNCIHFLSYKLGDVGDCNMVESVWLEKSKFFMLLINHFVFC